MERKLFLWSLVIIILITLAGCQSAPTPAAPATSTPVPANPATISTVHDLAGQWWRPISGGTEDDRYGWQIKEDGAIEVTREQKVANRVATLPLDSGKLWFEGTELHIQSGGGGDDGIYTVARVENDQIKFVAITDPDSERQTVITEDVWHK